MSLSQCINLRWPMSLLGQTRPRRSRAVATASPPIAAAGALGRGGRSGPSSASRTAANRTLFNYFVGAKAAFDLSSRLEFFVQPNANYVGRQICSLGKNDAGTSDRIGGAGSRYVGKFDVEIFKPNGPIILDRRFYPTSNSPASLNGRRGLESGAFKHAALDWPVTIARSPSGNVDLRVSIPNVKEELVVLGGAIVLGFVLATFHSTLGF